MKLNRLFALTLFTSVGFAFSPGIERISFHPEAGLTRAKSFEMAGEFNLDDFSVFVDGEDVGEIIGDFELSVTTNVLYELTDEYIASENGRALKLRRRFDSLGQSMGMAYSSAMDSGEQEDESSSDLEGKSVLFTWNEDDGSYDVQYDGEGGDDTLLESLEEDMDLRALLPDADVSIGDSWEVPLSELGSLFMPGGSMGLGMDEMTDEDMEMFDSLMGSDMIERFADIFEGSCVCVLESTGDAEGRSLAQIAVRVDANADTDISDLIMELLDVVSAEAGELDLDIEISVADLSFEYEAEGTFVWDYGAGVAKALELGGDASLGFDLGVSVSVMGESQDAELSVEMSGSYGIDVLTN